MSESLLELKGLSLQIGGTRLLDQVSLSLDAGECCALVGESGSGKSLTGLSLCGLWPASAHLQAEHWQFSGRNMQGLSERQWRDQRGTGIGMIFQNPMSALNPIKTIGEQISEGLRLRLGYSRRQARQESIAWLERLAVPDAAQRYRLYPHEFSCVMLQRVVIAAAVALRPKLLIPDEPTTALDVSVQAETLLCLDQLRRDLGMGLLFITHDLSVVAQIADRVAVMYAGQIVESASVTQIYQAPQHPYTQCLYRALPAPDGSGLVPIAGTAPDLSQPLQGCRFEARCPAAMAKCRQTPPMFELAEGRCSRCWLSEGGRVHA